MPFFSIPVSTATKEFRIFICILAVFMVLVGIFVFAGTLSAPSEPVAITDIAASEIINGGVYKINDLFVGDTYAQYSQTARYTGEVVKVDEQFYVAFFADKTGEIHCISLQVNADENIMTDISAFLANEDRAIGDLSLSGYFEARKIPDKINGYFQELLDWYNENDFTYPLINLNLVYQCDLETDYAAFAAKQQLTQRLIGIACIVAGIGVVPLVIYYQKDLKKQKEKAAAKARAWTMEEE